MAKVLEGSKQIAGVLGTTPKRVATFVRNGAPIRRISKGTATRYLAEEAALLRWVRCERKA